MTDQSAPNARFRLSSIAGLEEAGIVESFYFNAYTGLAGVTYTTNWIRILRAGMAVFDPLYNMALLMDDPVAMRTFVEREGTRLRAEAASEEAAPSKPRRAGRTRR